MTDASHMLMQSTPDVTAIGAMVLGIGLILWSTNRRFRRREPGPSDYLETHRQQLKEQQDVRQDMESLLVEIQSYVRQMSAQLDTKAAKLDALIVASDRQIQRLEALKDQIACGRNVDTTVSDGQEHAGAEQAETAGEPVTTAASTLDPVRQQVLTLSTDGLSPVEIAKKTDLPTGEVELILALHGRPASAND